MSSLGAVRGPWRGGRGASKSPIVPEKMQAVRDGDGSLLEKLGLPMERFGDSTGELNLIHGV